MLSRGQVIQLLDLGSLKSWRILVSHLTRGRSGLPWFALHKAKLLTYVKVRVPTAKVTRRNRRIERTSLENI